MLAGADEELRSGEEALAAGDAIGARSAARRVLARAPESLLGLALLADACEAGGLDAELLSTLEELARRAPSRAEVLVRLGRARLATEVAPADVRDAFARGLAVADAGSEARRDALIGLADLDLALGEGERAELWLERVAHDHSPGVEVRRAEALLRRGDAVGAKKLLDTVPIAPTDARAELVLGRVLAELGDPAAFVPLVRAMVLDAPGASEALSTALARLPSDAQMRTRARSVVDAKGEQDMARWRAAFAQAEGARDAARNALCDAVESGDASAAGALLDAALHDHDPRALRLALGALDPDDADPRKADARRLARALERDGVDRLDVIAPVADPSSTPWAEVIAADVARTLVPASGAIASWATLLGRLNLHAHAVGDLEAAARGGELAADRSRPVRLAVVGEFNAGKSTLINALIGTDAAPTGVLPTTATIHHLRWAPDPFAKILFAHGHVPRERIVALGELRGALKAMTADDAAQVERVEIGMPLATLVRVEILDTPGFNAPNAGHEAIARGGLEEADMAFWLLDATQPLKSTERGLLEEAERAGLPVQLLVNKADRLAPADLARVMSGLEADLANTPARSWTTPLALSAKKALAGKLGDAAALRESGWGAVERLLEEDVVARSAELKESALRRRAAALVKGLLRAWRVRASIEESEAKRRAQRTHESAQAAADLERNAEDLAIKLAESLAPQAAAWARDVDLVFVGRDRESADRDPMLARYRVDRALASIEPPLSRALASLAPAATVTPAALSPSTRAIVRAAAWCGPAEAKGMMTAIARAAIATLVDELFAQPSAGAPHHAAGVLRELEAFAAALA